MSLQSAVERLGLAIHDVGKNVRRERNEGVQVFSAYDERSLDNSASTIYHSEGHLQSDYLNQLIRNEINEVLEIMASLSEDTQTSNAKVNPAYPKMVSNPIAPPSVLSINHLRIVYTTIELIWVSGIQPFIEVEFGESFDWCEAPHPKSLLMSKENLASMPKVEGIESNSSNTLRYCQCIYNLISNSLFSANMLPRNLKRVLMAMLILLKSNKPKTPGKIVDLSDVALLAPTSDDTLALQLMTDICLNSSYKAFVVSELRIATKGPQWMRSAAGEWFTKILLSDLGFEAVLKTYLEGVTEGVDSLPLQINVAKLVTSVPSGFKREEYLRQLSPQIVDLMKFGVDVKDLLLLQTCVLVVTRIAHLCSDVCDSCLVVPLVSALLKIDRMSVAKGGTGSGDAISTAEELTAAVNALHTLVTICPLQPPLIAALQRSGACRAAMALTLFFLAESRDHKLLATLKEICFIIFKHPTGISELAVQLYDVILHPTRNRFVVSPEGLLSIEHSTAPSMNRQSGHAAADLARQLGVSNEGPGGKNRPPAVISSPPHLLAAIKSQIPSDDRVGEYSIATSLQHCSDRATEGEGEADAGRDVKDILSMAALAASSAERLSAARSDSATMMGRDSVLHNLQNVPALWDEGEDRAGDDGFQEGETQQARTAHVMLEVSVRAKAAAELLLLEQQSTHRQGQGQESGDANSATRALPSQRSVASKGREKEGEGGGEGNGEEEKACVAAELFIHCLEMFLEPSVTVAASRMFSLEAVGERTFCSASGHTSPQPVRDGDGLVKGLSGLVLVILQAHISLDRLLQGGFKIVGLVQAVLKAHAARLEDRAAAHLKMDSGLADKLSKNPSGAHRGRLVEEIELEIELETGSGSGSRPVPGSRALVEEDYSDERETGWLDFMEDIKGAKAEEEKDREMDKENEDEDADSSQSEILSCALGILIGILSLGKARRSRREEESLRALLWPLQVISYRETDEAIAQAATDAALLLLTRSCSDSSAGVPDSRTLGSTRHGVAGNVSHKQVSPAIVEMPSSSHIRLEHQGSESHLWGDDTTHHESAVRPSAFQASLFRALKDSCCSQEPYVRALGVHSISSALGSTSQPLTAADVDIGISTLITLLQDSDSYVYLCVLTAISKLADLPNSRSAVFRALLESFSASNEGPSAAGNGGGVGSGSSSGDKDRGVEETAHVLLSPRHRSLVGEALATVLRRAGDAAPSLVPLLVPSCIHVARVRPSAEDSRLVESLVDLRAMTMARSADDAAPEDDSETRSSTCAKAPVNQASSAALAGDRALLRQSAMSLLAEAVVCAGWSASKFLIDILDIAAGVLSMEGLAHSTQTSSSIRRSAAFLLRHVLSGLGDKLILMKDGGMHLKAAYRALKLAVRTDDKVVRYHCEAALGALDGMMRDQLFLSEAQLRGEGVPKIRILR